MLGSFAQLRGGNRYPELIRDTPKKPLRIALAAANRLCELYAWTQDGNEAMRGLNASLGYVTRNVCTRLRAELPLR